MGGGLLQKLYFAKQSSGPSESVGVQDPALDTGNTYWSVVSTDDGNAVHKTGDEEITGEKKFNFHTISQKLVVSDPIITKGNTLENKRYMSVYFGDKNVHDDFADCFGSVEALVNSNNVVTTFLKARQNVSRGSASDTLDAMLGVFNDVTNSIHYATAPSTLESRVNGQDILTRDWIPKDTRIVHTSGDETVTGIKSFDTIVSNGGFYKKHPSVTKGTDSNTTRYWTFGAFDKDSLDYNACCLGMFEVRLDTDKKTCAYIRALKNEANSGASAEIGVIFDKTNGIGYAYAPSTSSTRTGGTDILTRDWIPNDTRIAHTTGNETINGIKTFTSEIHLQNAGITVDSAPAANRYLNLFFTDSANESLGRFLYYSNSPSNGSRRGCSLDLMDSSKANHVMIAYSMALDGTDGVVGIGTNVFKFCPSAAGCTLGANSTTQRWGQIYSSITTISTSDERVKREISDIPNEVLDAWDDVNWVQFKMADSLEKKGESARIHNGMIAQQINSVFKQHNLDVSKYGLFCYDEWEKEDPSYDDNGHEISFGREAGNLYSLRYEEALCMEAAYNRREVKRLKERLSRLEEQLAS